MIMILATDVTATYRTAPSPRSSWTRLVGRVPWLFVGFVVASLVGLVAPARSQVTSDRPAAILVFPKVVVDTDGPDGRLDTFFTISNVSAQPINVLCYYINATERCDNLSGACFPERTCTGNCLPQWQQTDFRFRLTREQPTGWLASSGAGVGCTRLGRCSHDGTTVCQDFQDCPVGARCSRPPCLPLDGAVPGGFPGQTNQGSLIPPSPEDPFIGDLTCIAVDETGAPVDRNDLVGHGLTGFIRADGEFIDTAGYNPIGFPAIVGANNRNLTLVLGGPTGANPGEIPADAACLAAQPSTCAEYEGCPNILILDHYFDGAVDPQALNRCLPDGTCAVSGQACGNDTDCIENVCDLGPGTCTVTGHACAADLDCQDTCDAITERCTLSDQNCGPFGSQGVCLPTTYDVRVVTEVTMVPCSRDYEEGITFPRPGETAGPATTTVQFLVFNEFEQRLSTSTQLTCFKETPLWRLQGGNDPELSIFSVGVGGTLTGQTKMRGVVGSGAGSKPRGYALLAVANEFRCAGPIWEFPSCNFLTTEKLVSSAAKNVHFQGRRPQSDYIYLPLQ
jgi:hypothetical protein